MEHTKLPWTANTAHSSSTCANRIESLKSHGVVNAGWVIADCYGPDSEANAEYIVLACNAHDDLVAACEAWMKVESESKTSNPCPDYNLRAIYRKEAVKLSEAAIEKAGK